MRTVVPMICMIDMRYMVYMFICVYDVYVYMLSNLYVRYRFCMRRCVICVICAYVCCVHMRYMLCVAYMLYALDVLYVLCMRCVFDVLYVLYVVYVPMC